MCIGQFLFISHTLRCKCRNTLLGSGFKAGNIESLIDVRRISWLILSQGKYCISRVQI